MPFLLFQAFLECDLGPEACIQVGKRGGRGKRDFPPPQIVELGRRCIWSITSFYVSETSATLRGGSRHAGVGLESLKRWTLQCSVLLSTSQMKAYIDPFSFLLAKFPELPDFHKRRIPRRPADRRRRLLAFPVSNKRFAPAEKAFFSLSFDLLYSSAGVGFWGRRESQIGR